MSKPEQHDELRRSFNWKSFEGVITVETDPLHEDYLWTELYEIPRILQRNGVRNLSFSGRIIRREGETITVPARRLVTTRAAAHLRSLRDRFGLDLSTDDIGYCDTSGHTTAYANDDKQFVVFTEYPDIIEHVRRRWERLKYGYTVIESDIWTHYPAKRKIF